MNPNTVFDPMLGRFVPVDPNFAIEVATNIGELYANVGDGGSIEEVIFPHDPSLGNPVSISFSGPRFGVFNDGDLVVTVIPEPGTLATLGATIVIVLAGARRRRRRAAA